MFRFWNVRERRHTTCAFTRFGVVSSGTSHVVLRVELSCYTHDLLTLSSIIAAIYHSLRPRRPPSIRAPMSSLLSRYVVPQFPAYKGPYTVASFELEIPVSSLPTSQKPPNSAEPISTVQFRVFYPTAQKFKPADAESGPPAPLSGATSEGDSTDTEKTTVKTGWTSGWFRHRAAANGSSKEQSKPVYWLPEPHQREYLSGYARFLGAGSGLAELIS
jgi:hypothetical protein